MTPRDYKVLGHIFSCRADEVIEIKVLFAAVRQSLAAADHTIQT
jgi:hypothetical protein